MADIVSGHENRLAEHQIDVVKETKELEDKSRDLKAVSILKEALQTLHDATPQQLPYANIKSPDEVRNLASRFGVTGKESIQNLSRCDHTNIAKACGFFATDSAPLSRR